MSDPAITPEEARRLREAATPGPWTHSENWVNAGVGHVVGRVSGCPPETLALIAAAPSLAAEVERLSGEVERLRAAAQRVVALGLHPICELNARNGRTVCSVCEAVTALAATLTDEAE